MQYSISRNLMFSMQVTFYPNLRSLTFIIFPMKNILVAIKG